jgi:glycosyltransferase involved in cell wall biosynthesis
MPPGGRASRADRVPAPLISIVIATRNAAALLPKCLDSIRRQSFRDIEVLIGDGASSDTTVDIVKAYADIVTVWDSKPDTGPYSARNRMLPLAKGEWIYFLGADDWLPETDAFERIAPHLSAAAPHYRVVYGRVRLIDLRGRLVEEVGEPWELCKEEIRSRRCLAHQGVMHHRSLFEEHGLFDEAFKMAGDYEILLRELKSADALYVPEFVAAMGFGGQTTDLEYAYRLLGETRRALALHGRSVPRLRWAYLTFTAWCYLRLRALVGDTAARRLADVYRLVTLRKPRYSGRD